MAVEVFVGLGRLKKASRRPGWDVGRLKRNSMLFRRSVDLIREGVSVGLDGVWGCHPGWCARGDGV